MVLNGAGASSKTYSYQAPTHQAQAVSLRGPSAGFAEWSADERPGAPPSADEHTTGGSGEHGQGPTSA